MIGKGNFLMRTSVRVLANAIRADGYEQAFGSFVKKDFSGKPFAACALGQAALNLKVDPQRLSSALGQFQSVDGSSLSEYVISLNDSAKWSLDTIADRIERDWAHVLDEQFEV